MFVSTGKNNQLSIDLDKRFTESLINFQPLNRDRKKRSKLVKIKNSKVIADRFNMDGSMTKKEKFQFKKSLINGQNN